MELQGVGRVKRKRGQNLEEPDGWADPRDKKGISVELFLAIWYFVDRAFASAARTAKYERTLTGAQKKFTIRLKHQRKGKHEERKVPAPRLGIESDQAQPGATEEG